MAPHSSRLRQLIHLPPQPTKHAPNARVRTCAHPRAPGMGLGAHAGTNLGRGVQPARQAVEGCARSYCARVPRPHVLGEVVQLAAGTKGCAVRVCCSEGASSSYSFVCAPSPLHCLLPFSSVSTSTFELHCPPRPRSAHTQEASTSWHGEVIQSPDLFAHERDPSLLPSDAAGSYITCYDPSSGEHIETRRLLPAADVAAQVERADAAQAAWARTSFAERKSVLRSIKAWILRDIDQIVAVACRDTGKTREFC